MRRFAGRLLNSALGWATLLLFGKVEGLLEDRMGSIGSTQGVNDNKMPRPKNVASTANKLPSRISEASLSCSATGAPADEAASDAGSVVA